MVPMGALMKAVLIHSAQILSGAFRNTALPQDGPSIYQGFGVVRTSAALPFAVKTSASTPAATDFTVGHISEDNDVRIQTDGSVLTSGSEGDYRDLFVSGNYGAMQQLQQGQDYVHTFVLRPRAVKDQARLPTNDQTTFEYPALKATLVWHDPPAAQQANVQLINDLDLSISYVDPVSGTTTVTALAKDPLTGAAPDVTNNVEKLSIQIPAPASAAAAQLPSAVVEVSVRVAGKRVLVSAQPYALVVTGVFDRSADTFGAIAPTVARASLVVDGNRPYQLVLAGTKFDSSASATSTVVLCCTSSAGEVTLAPVDVTVVSATETAMVASAVPSSSSSSDGPCADSAATGVHSVTVNGIRTANSLHTAPVAVSVIVAVPTPGSSDSSATESTSSLTAAQQSAARAACEDLSSSGQELCEWLSGCRYFADGTGFVVADGADTAAGEPRCLLVADDIAYAGGPEGSNGMSGGSIFLILLLITAVLSGGCAYYWAQLSEEAKEAHTVGGVAPAFGPSTKWACENNLQCVRRCMAQCAWAASQCGILGGGCSNSCAAQAKSLNRSAVNSRSDKASAAGTSTSPAWKHQPPLPSLPPKPLPQLPPKAPPKPNFPKPAPKPAAFGGTGSAVFANPIHTIHEEQEPAAQQPQQRLSVQDRVAHMQQHPPLPQPGAQNALATQI
jgi:hypothetical protein